MKLQGSNIVGSSPSRGRVENDYYATNPDSIKALLKVEEIIYPAWECACGEGHIAKHLILQNDNVYASDLINRGYGDTQDFLAPLKDDYKSFKKINTIITNPPFALFQEFVERALNIAGKKVIMFGKLQALEGVRRATYLETTPLKTVYVFKKRQQPLRNGSNIDPLTGKKMASSTMAFAWFVWEKGYEGSPVIKWI